MKGGAVLLVISMIVVSSINAVECMERKFVQPLGAIIEFEDEVLRDDLTRARVESALEELAQQNGGCRKYKLIDIQSGTSQVINGIDYNFIAEVESVPTGKCLDEQIGATSAVFKIRIFEPAGKNAEKRYEFEKIVVDEL
nr:immunogenic protein ts11 [Hymenolepis microstoma]